MSYVWVYQMDHFYLTYLTCQLTFVDNYCSGVPYLNLPLLLLGSQGLSIPFQPMRALTMGNSFSWDRVAGIEVQIPISVSRFPVNWDRNFLTFGLWECLQEWYGSHHIRLLYSKFNMWIYGIEIVEHSVPLTFRNDAEDIIYIPFPFLDRNEEFRTQC